jgi:hypothetical protein
MFPFVSGLLGQTHRPLCGLGYTRRFPTIMDTELGWVQREIVSVQQP